MILFNSYIEKAKKSLLSSIDDIPLSFKRSLEINSTRNNNSNNISTSLINNQSISFPNRSSSTNRYNKNSYNGKKEIEELDITKTILEYDIQIASLKKKLSVIKDQRKQSELEVNIKKLRINKLLTEENASIKELQNIKKTIQKIKSSRKKNNNNYIKKIYIKNNKNKSHTIINNKSFANIKNSTFINSSFKDNNRLKKHKSFYISMKKNKSLNNDIQTNLDKTTSKENYFINKKDPISTSNRGIALNETYDLYSLRNTSINLDKININNKFIKNNENNNNNIENKKIIKNYSHLNINIKNSNNLKNQIKQNLENKLKEHEEERKKIQDKIKQIEQEQYELWMNFDKNMNNMNNTPNINTNNNHKILTTNDLYYKDEDDDNIVNYNFI